MIRVRGTVPPTYCTELSTVDSYTMSSLSGLESTEPTMYPPLPTNAPKFTRYDVSLQLMPFASSAAQFSRAARQWA